MLRIKTWPFFSVTYQVWGVTLRHLVKKNLDFGLKLGIPAIVLSVTTSVSIPTIDARRVTKLRESCGTCHELLLFQDLNVGDK